MTIDQLKDDLRLSKKLKVLQDIEIDQLRAQWEEAVEERNKTEAHIIKLVEDLWSAQQSSQVVTA